MMTRHLGAGAGLLNACGSAEVRMVVGESWNGGRSLRVSARCFRSWIANRKREAVYFREVTFSEEGVRVASENARGGEVAGGPS